MSSSSDCPICHGPSVGYPEDLARTDGHVQCQNCGWHVFPIDAVDALSLVRDEDQRVRVAHGLRWLRDGQSVTAGMIHQFLRTALPAQVDRVDLLIRFVAEQFDPERPASMLAWDMRGAVGARSADGARWAIEQAMAEGYVQGKVKSTLDSREWLLQDASLTAAGWRHYEALMRAGAGSRHAFMAMKFNDPELDCFFVEHLKPAVKATGFDLRTVTGDHKTPGLIDVRMRVEIRTSKFLVCDLSHANLGAYWEAGFAEGLGRPVFYTCRHDVLNDKQHSCHPHFDAAHQAIVAWNPDDPAAAVAELKAMIRNTLPNEAVMTDARNRWSASKTSMQLPELCTALANWCSRTPLVARAWVFGSRARGEEKAGSDVDIAIELDLAAASGVDESGGSATWMLETDSWESELGALIPYELDLEQFMGSKTPTIAAALERSSILVYTKDAAEGPGRPYSRRSAPG